MIKEVTDDTFEEQILKASGYNLLYFWKKNTTTCAFGADELEKQIPLLPTPVSLFSLDVSDNPATVALFNITATPAYVLFEGGRFIAVKTGLLQGKSAKAWLERSVRPPNTEGGVCSIASALRFAPSPGG